MWGLNASHESQSHVVSFLSGAVAWGGWWGLQTQVFGVSLRVLLSLEETKADVPTWPRPQQGWGGGYLSWGRSRSCVPELMLLCARK